MTELLSTAAAADIGQSFCPLLLTDEITLVRCPTAPGPQSHSGRGTNPWEQWEQQQPSRLPLSKHIHPDPHALTHHSLID